LILHYANEAGKNGKEPFEVFNFDFDMPAARFLHGRMVKYWGEEISIMVV